MFWSSGENPGFGPINLPGKGPHLSTVRWVELTLELNVYNYIICNRVRWGARCLALRTRNGRFKNSFIPGGTLPTHLAYMYSPNCGRNMMGFLPKHMALYLRISYSIRLPDRQTCSSQDNLLLSDQSTWLEAQLTPLICIGDGSHPLISLNYLPTIRLIPHAVSCVCVCMREREYMYFN